MVEKDVCVIKSKLMKASDILYFISDVDLENLTSKLEWDILDEKTAEKLKDNKQYVKKEFNGDSDYDFDKAIELLKSGKESMLYVFIGRYYTSNSDEVLLFLNNNKSPMSNITGKELKELGLPLESYIGIKMQYNEGKFIMETVLEDDNNVIVGLNEEQAKLLNLDNM